MAIMACDTGCWLVGDSWGKVFFAFCLASGLGFLLFISLGFFGFWLRFSVVYFFVFFWLLALVFLFMASSLA